MDCSMPGDLDREEQLVAFGGSARGAGFSVVKSGTSAEINIVLTDGESFPSPDWSEWTRSTVLGADGAFRRAE